MYIKFFVVLHYFIFHLEVPPVDPAMHFVPSYSIPDVHRWDVYSSAYTLDKHFKFLEAAMFGIRHAKERHGLVGELRGEVPLGVVVGLNVHPVGLNATIASK